MEEQPLIPSPEQEPTEHATDNPELLGDLLVRHSLERPEGTQPVKRPEAEFVSRAGAAYEKRPKSSEAVLQRVADAAEHEEPIERQLELRHEIKDTDKRQVNPLFAQKVPATPARPITSLQYPSPVVPTLLTDERANKPGVFADYRQPIRIGFYLGIVLTLSFILFLVLQ
jgi:hypothetical protein